MRHKSYVLTARATTDLHEARAWSRARWGRELTHRYFQDLHEGALYVAGNQAALRDHHELAGGTSLRLHAVREHCLVYEPLSPQIIAIVAVIRQGRDIPAILQKWAEPIRRELLEVRSRVERREIPLPRQRIAESRKSR